MPNLTLARQMLAGNAYAIAKHQRDEEHLQPADVLLEKWDAEFRELFESAPRSVDALLECADVFYYAVCVDAVRPADPNTTEADLTIAFLEWLTGFSAVQIVGAAVVKYSRRAHGMKDAAAEAKAVEFLMMRPSFVAMGDVVFIEEDK
jgi:hypothetical protein